MLVHRTFNVSIPRHHIPTETWEFEYGPAEFGLAAQEGDEDDSQAVEHSSGGGRWIHKVTGEVLDGSKGLLEFIVIG